MRKWIIYCFILTISFPILFLSTVNVFGSSSALTVTVVAGKTTISQQGDVTYSTLVPASSSYTTSISVPQDEGYFLKILRNGTPAAGAPLEASMQTPSGWTAWGDWKYKNTTLTTDNQGVVKIDFVDDWGKMAPATYTAKFRVKGTTNESNPVAITVTTTSTAKYFRFEPGNYWIFKGCNGVKQEDLADFSSCPTANLYETRFDVEERQFLTISDRYTNPSLNPVTTHTINSNPLRVTNSVNAPITQSGGNTNYTTFLSAGFDTFGNVANKWDLKTIFYPRSSDHVINRTRLGTAVFLRKYPDWPSYFYISNPHDLSQSIFYTSSPDNSKYSLSMRTYGVNCSNFIDGDISSTMSCTNTTGRPNVTLYGDGTVGWNTDSRMVNVNFPRFKGRVLRTRYWEYTSDISKNVLDAVGWNYDEWFYSEQLGLVAINNKYGRGQRCGSDPDCNNSTQKMQTPTFSVSLYDYMFMTNQTSFTAKAKTLNGSEANSITIAPGNTYQVTLKDSNNKPYTGFVEVQGESSTNRSAFKDINDKPLWLDQGAGSVLTGTNQAGTFKVKVRPLILSDVRELGDNNLPWSNIIEVNVSTSVPPVNTPAPTPTPNPADANEDGKVNNTDYLIWQNHYNQDVTNGSADGDFDHNGLVNNLDYAVWLNNR